jgi:hypothetical protein
MIKLRKDLLESQIRLEKDEGNNSDTVVRLPLGDTLEIWDEFHYFSCRVKKHLSIISHLTHRTLWDDGSGYTTWVMSVADEKKLVNIICRLNYTEIVLRNRIQMDALLFIGVLQKYDRQRPLYQRLTKDITKWIGRFFYELALKRARESL